MAQVDKSQFLLIRNGSGSRIRRRGRRKRYRPGWDYINPDGSWHVNYAFYDPPAPTAEEIARTNVAQQNKWVQLQPAQGGCLRHGCPVLISCGRGVRSG